MGSTPICTIDDTGIHKPEFATVLAYFTAGFQSIFGADVYLGNDSVDGQQIGLLASAVDDCNGQTVADYNAYSPATARGTGLSSIVKTNNIQRKVPSSSTLPLTVYGVWGTEIVNGAVSDGTNTWLLPASVVIPFVGEILVTCTCATAGAVSIGAGVINTEEGLGSLTAGITPGWQGATNLSVSAPGTAVESDPQLRQRQSLSTSIPAQTTLQALRGALLAIDGVSYVQVYDNSTLFPDANGVPGMSICVVIEGGDDGLIAQMIALKKGVCGTYGTSAQIVTDINGIARTIRYYRLTRVPISVALTLKIVDNFTQAYQIAIAVAQAAYTGALTVGETVYRLEQLQALVGVASGYKVEGIALARDGLPPTESDVALAFNEVPYCDPSYISFPGLPPLVVVN